MSAKMGEKDTSEKWVGPEGQISETGTSLVGSCSTSYKEWEKLKSRVQFPYHNSGGKNPNFDAPPLYFIKGKEDTRGGDE